ncbi:membrane integrity-associated transporter subunit PqiC [Enterobacillus tribolii]|nr:membrane integrity-associated transporter subunit PqiC [Enterobacillus tribolii]MBW7982435.1 membrane integrity-associated transporter subunit PqiC [Enterobacillus tribolii]
MKRWIIAATVLLLAGCSGSANKSYYQLPAATGAVTAVAGQDTGRQLWLEHVAVADYLGGNGVVYQTNDVQYVIASNNLWASPLEQQLQQTMLSNLSAMLPGWIVTGQSLGADQDVLNITVTGFHGRYDGKAVISGSWVLNHKGTLTRRAFNLEVAQPQDGYDALVRALAEGWQREAGQIATQLAAIR